MKSGQESWIYIDHGDALCQPSTERPFIEAIGTIIENSFSNENVVLLNLASKSSPHVTGAVAFRNDCRQIIVSPEAVADAERGTNRNVRLPNILKGEDILVVVDDVLTSGETLKRGLKIARNALRDRLGDGADKLASHLVVGINRATPETIEILKQEGITITSLASIEEIITIIWQKLTPKQQAGLLGEFPMLSQRIGE